MGKNTKTFTDQYGNERKGSFWQIAVLLAVIVALCWLLGNSGSADSEAYCGYEEHQHVENCYEKVLTCGFEEEADAEVHVHNESCYTEVLTCEIPEHKHGILCFSNGTADVETASDWESTLPEVIPDNWNEAVLAIARSQIGYEESQSNFCLAEDGETRQGYTRYGAWYGDEYGDWDAMFACFCLSYAGIPEEYFPQVSDAEEWAAVLDETGLWAGPDGIPAAGDLIFFGSGSADVSVGIVSDVNEEENTLSVIEGNYCGAVCENTYNLDDARILGYGLLPENPEIGPEKVIYEADAGGVEISVTVPADALPENAVLNVIPYEENSEEYAVALALVQDAKNSSSFRTLVSAETGSDSLKFGVGSEENTESGTVILDVFFTADGTEVEPESAADVTVNASKLLAGCGGEVESLEVWHLEETEYGTEPVLAAVTSDAESPISFTVESFSEFEFHYTCSMQGWAGFGVNLIDESGDTISATVSSSYTITSGRYTTTVDMPYTFTMQDFAGVFSTVGTYQFLYATVTDPNYGDNEHTFDEWPGEEQVGANKLYGSEENPVVSVTIDGTAASKNPNYDPDNTGAVVSKTWHFTLTYADDEESFTIPIYGNADGANDSGGKYCPKYLEINLYYQKVHEAVFNLGNGNGTDSDGDYTGSSNSGGDELRYGTGILDDYADNDGNMTIHLPSDDNLDSEFTVVDAVSTEGEEDYQPAVTISLGKEQAYDYQLVGWINIATGEYYDVSKGSTTAEINLSNDNVFYADWIAASYDHGSKTDEGLRDDTVSTSDFVTFELFDYNELFNLYSASLTQNSTSSETWSDSGSLYSEPLLGQEEDSLTRIGSSFIFQNNGTTRANSHVLSHANPAMWNLWTSNSLWADQKEYNFVLDAKKYWGITSPGSTILGMLYDEKETSLGVHYVGTGDYLFWVDENGYYTYDSAVSGAAYNQSDGRFYVYEDNANSFFPYNTHTESNTSSNGLTNYWFGMYMEVEFYLPNSTSTGSEEIPVNQIDGNEMIFDFSGDDDILIFIDDQLVVDMSGIHSTSYSRINFSTNTVTCSMGLDEDGAPDTTGTVEYSINDHLNLSAGYHTMQIYYMERGASASNLKIQFNVTPDWKYENWPVQTVTAEKVWEDALGNVIDPSDLPEEYRTSGIEVGLFDALGKAVDAGTESSSEAVFGYTMDGNGSYRVEYEYDDGILYQYIYTVHGNSPSLTYTAGQREDSGEISWDSPVIYVQMDQNGRVLDSNGYVIAWLEGDGETAKLHIRIDQQTLNDENGWSYDWELLDPEGNYEVMELSGSSSYTTKSTTKDLTSHTYWSVIGEKELETSLADGVVLPIILTEAAQEHGTIGDSEEAYGWVIVASSDGSEPGITMTEVKFSHQGILEIVKKDNKIVEDSEEVNSSEIDHYQSVLGVTSQSEIDALGSGAVWYVSDTGHSLANDGDAEEFYLYCLIGTTPYYLTTTDNGGSQTLSLTTHEEDAAVFIYDFLGELRVVQIGDDEADEASYRVTIDSSGNINLEAGADETELNDVRIYTLSEIGTDGFSFTAANVFLPDLTIKKTDSKSGNALSGVTFSLENEDGEYYAGLDSNQEVIWESTKRVFSTGSDGIIVFECLPEGTYTLTEEASLSGYNALPSSILITVTIDAENGTVLSVSWKNGGGSDEIGKYVSVSKNGVELVIQNIPTTETPPSEDPTVAVNITKIWADDGNRYGTRPETITIFLLADGEIVTDAYGEPVTAVISADDGWFWSFPDLPKYNAEGEEIRYTIEETAVPGYTTEIRDYMVTNTLETVRVEGSKTWNDGENADGIRPDSITVHLYADGEEIAAVAVSEGDSWAWSFGDLPRYQQDGTTEIVYTIEEDPVDGYETEYDGYNIINSHPTRMDIPVTKEWDDAEDADGIRPGSVTVELYLNGEPTGRTLTLNEEDGWTGVFTDLENETNGVKNAWSVVETAVDGYESTVSGDAENGFLIINTHNPEEIAPSEGNPDEMEEPKTPGESDLSEMPEEPALSDEAMEAEPSMPQTGYRWNLALCIGMLSVGGTMLICVGSGMTQNGRKQKR